MTRFRSSVGDTRVRAVQIFFVPEMPFCARYRRVRVICIFGVYGRKYGNASVLAGALHVSSALLYH